MNKTPTIAEDLKKLMDGWNTIEEAAKKEFPNATKDELYEITKGAMDFALFGK